MGFVLALIAGAALHGGGLASVEAATCAGPHAGGDWPLYGQNTHNTRRQDAETTIDAANVGTLTNAWRFTPADFGGTGRMESTPVVGEGCVYVSTSSGFVYALNADSGELVWGKRLATASAGQCCGGTIFAGAVHDGVVYFGVGRHQRTPDPISGKTATFITALNSQTGAEIWKSPELALEPGAYTNSSVVYYKGLVWLGISGDEVIVPGLAPNNRVGGFVIVDAANGTPLVRTRTVPIEDFEIRGDAGGSIWSTAAIDDDGYGYAGTGQPNAWEGSIQSDYTNAIIKFDMERMRNGAWNPYFGQILGTIPGDRDLGRDVDMAGSPSLYRDADGLQMVAAAQKSGNLHAGRTSSGLPVGPQMLHVWEFPLSGIGSPLYNFCSVANDGSNVYAVGAIPGQLWSINGTTGAPNWVQAVNTNLAAEPVAFANGVVYFPGQNGTLYALDATTGNVLLQRNMRADGATGCANIGGGLAIARNTVYAMCGDRGNTAITAPESAASGWVMAYRLP